MKLKLKSSSHQWIFSSSPNGETPSFRELFPLILHNSHDITNCLLESVESCVVWLSPCSKEDKKSGVQKAARSHSTEHIIYVTQKIKWHQDQAYTSTSPEPEVVRKFIKLQQCEGKVQQRCGSGLGFPQNSNTLYRQEWAFPAVIEMVGQ